MGLSAIFVGVIILMCTNNGINHDEGHNMLITITAPLDIKAQYSYSGYALEEWHISFFCSLCGLSPMSGTI